MSTSVRLLCFTSFLLLTGFRTVSGQVYGPIYPFERSTADIVLIDSNADYSTSADNVEDNNYEPKGVTNKAQAVVKNTTSGLRHYKIIAKFSNGTSVEGTNSRNVAPGATVLLDVVKNIAPDAEQIQLVEVRVLEEIPTNVGLPTVIIAASFNRSAIIGPFSIYFDPFDVPVWSATGSFNCLAWMYWNADLNIPEGIRDIVLYGEDLKKPALATEYTQPRCEELFRVKQGEGSWGRRYMGITFSTSRCQYLNPHPNAPNGEQLGLVSIAWVTGQVIDRTDLVTDGKIAIVP